MRIFGAKMMTRFKEVMRENELALAKPCSCKTKCIALMRHSGMDRMKARATAAKHSLSGSIANLQQCAQSDGTRNNWATKRRLKTRLL